MGIIGASAKRRGESSLLRCELPESPPHLHQPPAPPPEFSTVVFRAVLLAVVIGLIYLLVDHQSDFSAPLLQISPSDDDSSPFHIFKSDHLPPQKKKEQESDGDGNKLESILKRASMKDGKTVIITSVNATWAEPFSLFDLFLASMRDGNQTAIFLQNLVVVALDQEAYSSCITLHHLCFALTTHGLHLSGEATADYLKMVWRKIEFLGSVLEMGYNFIYSDADVAWMRDPFERLYEDGDVQISCDVYLQNSTTRHNYPNTGFVYAKSNHRTIQFYKYWYAKREAFPGVHDQGVLEKIKFDSFIDETGLDMRFLDTAYFGGLCEASQGLDVVVTMHGNCCTKLESKIHDLKMVMDDWKKYMMRRSLSRSWTLPWHCGGGDESKFTQMKGVAQV